MANSNSYNATGAATDPLGREARTVAPILRKGALVLAGAAIAVTPAVAGAAGEHAAVPRQVTHARVVADCTQGTPGCPIYFHAGKFLVEVRRAR